MSFLLLFGMKCDLDMFIDAQASEMMNLNLFSSYFTHRKSIQNYVLHKVKTVNIKKPVNFTHFFFFLLIFGVKSDPKMNRNLLSSYFTSKGKDNKYVFYLLIYLFVYLFA